MASADAATETKKMALTTDDSFHRLATNRNAIYLVSDADCLVQFDESTGADSFLIKANQYYHMEAIQVTVVHAKAVTGTANLYIMAAS